MIQVANVAVLMLHTVSFQHPWHPQLAQVTIGKVPHITTGVVSLVGSLCLLSGVCLLGVVLRGGAEGTGGACGSEVGRGTLQNCGGGGVGADPVPAGKVVVNHPYLKYEVKDRSCRAHKLFLISFSESLSLSLYIPVYRRQFIV